MNKGNVCNSNKVLDQVFICNPRGQMDKGSAYGPGVRGFESCGDQLIILSFQHTV